MPGTMKRAALIIAILAGSAVASFAANVLTAANGMTLYTFDKDTGGTSSCYDDCAAKWPPYTATKADAMAEDWTKITRTDGTLQWAYDGKPVYLFSGDTAKGDATGDGLGGVWHIIKE